MVKAKSKARIRVADGAGGMMDVPDRRFETNDWSIQFDVPTNDADVWLKYLHAECSRRGWSSGGIGQLEARENSGSITFARDGQPQMDVVWDWKRGCPIKVRARSAATTDLSHSDLLELFDQINLHCRKRVTERFYRRGQLQYQGLAWRGELWLDDTLRLGPPTAQYEATLVGPRIVIVDALVDCVGRPDFPQQFEQNLGELATFLSVVIGTPVRLEDQGSVWTYTTGADDCAVRSLGYFERQQPQEMPTRGACPPVPLIEVNRPDFSFRGIDGTIDEASLPSDVTDLWAAYCALAPDRRIQFLQAALKYQEAMVHWGEQATLSFALMVVACEALKPPTPEHKRHNMYHVVEALLGKQTSDQLRQDFQPQDTRSAHLHRGDLFGSEMVRDLLMSSYHDPTFAEAHRKLARITQATLIEWLRRSGTVTIPVHHRRRTWRRWMKDIALYALPILTVLALVIGTIIGWHMKSFWPD